MNHSHHGQTSILRFDEADGASVPAPGMKPASAAYGVDNNERLGYYYAGGPQYGPPYPQYGGFDHTGNPHHHPPQAGYGYAQDGEEEADGNAEVEGEGEGEGDDDQEVYGSRVEENAVSFQTHCGLTSRLLIPRLFPSSHPPLSTAL